MFREMYCVCSDHGPPGREEYDQVMVTQQVISVLMRPGRVYSLLRKWQFGQATSGLDLPYSRRPTR